MSDILNPGWYGTWSVSDDITVSATEEGGIEIESLAADEVGSLTVLPGELDTLLDVLTEIRTRYNNESTLNDWLAGKTIARVEDVNGGGLFGIALVLEDGARVEFYPRGKVVHWVVQP